jgi:DNA-binding NarL/FixJ family response regulator
LTAIHEHQAQVDSRAIAPDASDSPLRVLVVDDHPAVRMGLRELFEDQPDFVVVAAVDSADAAMALAEREPVDVAVVDYQLGSRNGLWLSRKLKRLPRPPRVVIYSAYCDGPLAATSVVAEADGLVSKGGVGADLCDAVRAVAHGQVRLPTVPPALASALRRRLAHAEHLVGESGVAAVDDASQARGASQRLNGSPPCPAPQWPAPRNAYLTGCFTDLSG